LPNKKLIYNIAMKTFQNFMFLFMIGFIFFSSCNKEEVELPNNLIAKDTIYTNLNVLSFKIMPLSDNQFRFAVLNDGEKSYELKIKCGGETLLSQPINEKDPYIAGLYSDVTYAFNHNAEYQIFVLATYEENNTIVQAKSQVYFYKHRYKNELDYQKVADTNQLLEVDITPLRDAIFYEDYVHNKVILKRLTLNDDKLEVINDDFPFTPLRSIDTANLVMETKFFGDHYLGKDSSAIVSLNLNSNAQRFLGWGSNDYGRYSRIVNNNIFISNPVASGKITRIDLLNYSSQEYPADIRFLRENSYDNVYLNSDVYDFTSSAFKRIFPTLGNGFSIVYFDAELGYAVVEEGFYGEEQNTYYTRFLVYKDDKIMYEQSYERGLTLQFPSLIDFSTDKIIFYKGYDYGAGIRFDGYYSLDLKTNEVELIQNDSEEYYYVRRDFFLNEDSDSFISVRPHGIYKITQK